MRFFKKCRFLSVKYFVKWQIKPQGLSYTDIGRHIL